MNRKNEITPGRVVKAKKGVLTRYDGLLTVIDVTTDGVKCCYESGKPLNFWLDASELIIAR